MSDDDQELDALFDEIAAQRAQPADASAPPARAAEPAAEPMPDGSAAPAERASAPGNELPMYDCLGGIVRQLHDALRELGYDRAIADVVSQVSDSQNRLVYIASLTEQAANKVLNAVDEAMPAQEALGLAAQQLESRWQSMFAGALKLDEFKCLAHDSHEFAASSVRSAEAEKARLMSIMMAQDFQDITGQIIKKVLDLTQNLEKELAQMLLNYAPAPPRERPAELMSGPGFPATAMAQDDVDHLLSELGF